MTEHPELFKISLRLSVRAVKSKSKSINSINLGNFDAYSALSATMTDAESAAVIVAAKSLDLLLRKGVDRINGMTPDEILIEVTGGILN